MILDTGPRVNATQFVIPHTYISVTLDTENNITRVEHIRWTYERNKSAEVFLCDDGCLTWHPVFKLWIQNRLYMYMKITVCCSLVFTYTPLHERNLALAPATEYIQDPLWCMNTMYEKIQFIVDCNFGPNFACYSCTRRKISFNLSWNQTIAARPNQQFSVKVIV